MSCSSTSTLRGSSGPASLCALGGFSRLDAELMHLLAPFLDAGCQCTRSCLGLDAANATCPTSAAPASARASCSSFKSAIASGEPVKVVFDEISAEETKKKQRDDWQDAAMGTLKGGETYSVQYDPSGKGFTTSGFNQYKQANLSPEDAQGMDLTSTGGDPNSSQINLWGRMYTFDDDGNVFDPTLGRVVGHVER